MQTPPGGPRGRPVRGSLRHNGRVTANLLTRARAGDADAFGELVGPYRHELEVHCYRILGSASGRQRPWLRRLGTQQQGGQDLGPDVPLPGSCQVNRSAVGKRLPNLTFRASEIIRAYLLNGGTPRS
jgi:hypothetical protein